LHARLAALDLACLRGLADRYLPELVSDHALSSRQICRELVRVLPSAAVDEHLSGLLVLDDGDLARTLHHILLARLQQIPWLGKLRQMSYDDLRGVFAKLGVDMPKTRRRRRLVGKLVKMALTHGVLMARLIGEVHVPQGRRVARSKAGDDSLPPWHDIGPSSAYAQLQGRLEGALDAMGPAAMRSMVEKFLPSEGVRRRGSATTSARLLTQVVPRLIPREDAQDMLSLEGGALIGAFCHWLDIYRRRTPLAAALLSMSLPQLLNSLNLLGVPAYYDKPDLVAIMLKGACRHDTFRQELGRLLSQVNVTSLGFNCTDVGYMDECPDLVRRTVLHRFRERPQVQAS